MTTLGNGQILENGMKLMGMEDTIIKRLKSDEAENICKSLFKDQAIIAGCGLVLPEVPISGTFSDIFLMITIFLIPQFAVR